jgi:hypothetical protein
MSTDRDLRQQLAVLVEDLVLLQPGQAVQAHVEDRLGLHSDSR